MADIPQIGSYNGVNFHILMPKAQLHMPQIIVRDISAITMAGGIRQWMGLRAIESKFQTITFTKSGSTAISTENSARKCVGYVYGLTLMTAASLTDTFWFECSDLDVQHTFCIPDSGNYDTATIFSWSGYLVRQGT